MPFIEPFPKDIDEILDRVQSLCNEEGKLKGLTPNRLFGSDVIAGRFFVVKVDDDGELTDLNDGDISKYYEMFKTPLTEAQTEYYDRILSIFRE